MVAEPVGRLHVALEGVQFLVARDLRHFQDVGARQRGAGQKARPQAVAAEVVGIETGGAGIVLD